MRDKHCARLERESDRNFLSSWFKSFEVCFGKQGTLSDTERGFMFIRRGSGAGSTAWVEVCRRLKRSTAPPGPDTVLQVSLGSYQQCWIRIVRNGLQWAFSTDQLSEVAVQPHEDSPFRSIRGADWVHWGMFALTRRLVAIWFRWRVSQLNQFLVFYSDFLIYLPGFLAGFLSKWKWFGFQSLEPSLNAILFTWLKANRRHTIFFWNWPGNKIKQLACRFQAHY